MNVYNFGRESDINQVIVKNKYGAFIYAGDIEEISEKYYSWHIIKRTYCHKTDRIILVISRG